MIDVCILSDEIAELDILIETYEVMLREARQQREFKLALLGQLQSRGIQSIERSQLIQESVNTLNE